MKKTLWTAAAAVVVAAALVAVLAPQAVAATPKTKFAAVKKAFLAKTAQTEFVVELDVTDVQEITLATPHGEKLTPEEAQKLMKDQGIDIAISMSATGDLQFEFNFDFDASSYSSMSFGPNENVLLLTPKTSKDTRYKLAVDPKTNLPYKVTLESSKKGRWMTVTDSKVRYKPKGGRYTTVLDKPKKN